MGRDIPGSAEHTAIPANRDDEFYGWQDIRSSGSLCRKLEPSAAVSEPSHAHRMNSAGLPLAAATRGSKGWID